MLITTDGIVLHSTKYSDTSLVVKIFTEKRGVESFLVKGAFGKKSRFKAALFSPLAIVNITYDERNGEKLKYLKDLSRQTQPADLIYDPARSAILMFYNELLYKLLFNVGEDPGLFHLLQEEVRKVYKEEDNLTDLPLRFMLRLSQALGICPENNYSEKNCYFSLPESRFQSYCMDETTEVPKEESYYLSQLLNHESNIVVTRSVRNHLLHYLIDYYKIHNEQIRVIESVAILAGVLH